MTEPLTAPLGKAARICDVAGIVFGLLTGLHPLVIVCVKHLAKDEISPLAAGCFKAMMRFPVDDPHAAAPAKGVIGPLSGPESSPLLQGEGGSPLSKSSGADLKRAAEKTSRSPILAALRPEEPEAVQAVSPISAIGF